VDSLKFDLSSFQSIDTQGRRNLWTLTWNEALETPIIGKGSGSASQLILSAYPPLEHPHNDFLRVFHDLGFIGLLTFVFAWTVQILHNLKYWIIFDKKRNYLAYFHLAAMIATVAIFISFMTDNTLTYVFVLIPLNIIYSLADSPMKDDTSFYQMQLTK
jgi:O-antigen ligase